MKRFTCLSIGFWKEGENLVASTGLHVAYFTFCWQMRQNHNNGKLRPTPCQMAGVACEKSTVEDLYHAVW